jgi:hypothetical protein
LPLGWIALRMAQKAGRDCNSVSIVGYERNDS